MLYGIGVGPGDPELMTVKAVRVLEQVSWIAVPNTGKEQSALSIAAPYIQGKPLILCPAPMTREKDVLQKARLEGVRLIAEKLDQGEDVAFITLGDPSIYSTYIYLHRILKEQGYPVQMIPGVPSFCAAAAALSDSLCDGGEPLHILPASYDPVEKLLTLPGTKVLMKSGKSLSKVKQLLQGQTGQRVQMAECCSTPQQKLYDGVAHIPDDSSYFSIIVVRQEENE